MSKQLGTILEYMINTNMCKDNYEDINKDSIDE